MIRQFSSSIEALTHMQNHFTEYWGKQPISTVIAFDRIVDESETRKFKLVRNEGDAYAGDEAYIEFAVRHTNPTAQVALGRLKYDAVGLVIVTVKGDQNLSLATGPSIIADQALRYFQLAPGGVSYTNSQMSEVGKTGNWYQVNVIAEFLYQVIRQPITEVN